MSIFLKQWVLSVPDAERIVVAHEIVSKASITVMLLNLFLNFAWGSELLSDQENSYRISFSSILMYPLSRLESFNSQRLALLAKLLPGTHLPGRDIATVSLECFTVSWFRFSPPPPLKDCWFCFLVLCAWVHREIGRWYQILLELELQAAGRSMWVRGTEVWFSGKVED